jgi:D-cysteine desulfhydrase
MAYLMTVSPTPVHRLPRLAETLEMDPDCLWVKREDLTGLAGGGNKSRKLQALVADALAGGCDCLVTGGGAQSNHARMTAAAANIAGLDCELLLTRPPGPFDPGGNVLLDRVLGATIHWVEGEVLPYAELESAIQDHAEKLARDGRRPYALPIGGSSALGAYSYAEVARELDDLIDPDLVVVATGSGGTHAGLVAGFGDHCRVLGVDVGARPALATAVEDLAVVAAAMAGLPRPSGSCQLDTGQTGGGYGLPTEAAREALLTVARTEALLLDPVYTAKAMAGLFAARRSGRISRTTRVVFIHTGGLPGLFTQRFTQWLTGESR